jgi:cell fate (sporulation/competence/biofilm development) regulator YlbF (YheA/YmcA/DUF963 family)
MKVKNIKTNSDGSMELSLKINLDESGSFLQTEESIMDNVNEFGQFLTEISLKKLDEENDEIEKNEKVFKFKSIKKKL